MYMQRIKIHGINKTLGSVHYKRFELLSAQLYFSYVFFCCYKACLKARQGPLSTKRARGGEEGSRSGGQDKRGV